MAKKRHLLSYLGGVFDGEGCVQISKGRACNKLSNPQYQVSIQVSMCDGIIPMLFQNVFGGSIGTFKTRTEGKPQFRWRVTGYSCLPILTDILPYVLIKRPQVEVAIHCLGHMGSWKGSRRISDTELALREADYILSKNLKKESISPTINGGKADE